MAFDYTKYNYDELVEEVTRLVAKKDEWKDAFQSSASQILIQLVAATVSQLHYMLERRTEENYISTAKLSSSVNAIAGGMGYRPKRIVSSSGTLHLNLVDANGNPVSPPTSPYTIEIPKYTKVTYEGENFLTSKDLTIDENSQANFEVPILEGTVKTVTFNANDVTSTLYKNGYILIEDYSEIEDGSIVISDDVEAFTDVTIPKDDAAPIGAISFATSTDAAYDIRHAHDGMRIIFGNGDYGKKPVGTVTVSWVVSKGKKVNINTTGNTFKFENEELTDNENVVPANTYRYTLVNSTLINGGTDADTTEDIRTKAPDYVRTANRAVTKHDYNHWAKKSGIGGIIDAFSYGEEELNTINQYTNNVFITYLTSSGDAFSVQEETDFRDYMDEYKTVTTHIIPQAATSIPVQMTITVKRNLNVKSAESEIYEIINAAVKNMFTLSEGSIGKDLYYSDIVEEINSLTVINDGVERRVAEYVDVKVNLLYTVTSDGTLTTFQLPRFDNINDAYVKGTLYIRDVTNDNAVVDFDDGAGNFNGGGTITDSGLATGLTTLTTAGDYVIQYQVDNYSNALCSEDQVLTYHEPEPTQAAAISAGAARSLTRIDFI